MAESELKPCPFCGKTEHIKVLEHPIDVAGIEIVHIVYCTYCGGQIRSPKRKDAIMAWNRREGRQSMRGTCEPICDGVSVMSDNGGIAIHFNPGEKWHFHQDRKHADRLLVDKGQDIAISMTVRRFYETFEVKEREGSV